jgi:signal transduction histidine kinase
MAEDPSLPSAQGRDPLRDPARLEALRRTELLDTPPEEVFERLTRLVCRLLGVPVALVSLVEADRQFFKSAVGLPLPWALHRQTPLSHSFCRHVVASGAPLMVQDASRHPLVCDNLAVSELGVMAYLGMPLATADGQVLGALCAIDTEPRTWRPEDAAALRDLASMAVSEISLRRLAFDLEAQVRDEVAAREAAQARRAQTARLEALGQLAGGVAHDFANVLQAVQGGVRMAAGRLDTDPASARHLLEMVDDVTRRGTSVTRRVLAFARRGEIGTGPVDVGALLADLEEVLTQTLGGAVGIRVVVEPSLPAVLADRGELEAVLVNLATNARDAMPGRGTLTLTALAERISEQGGHSAGLSPGNYIRLSAEDTGTGMDAATLARAAEPFFTTKPAGQGTGLGLAMARDFAEHAGGGLDVASEPGRGTTVTVWLPCAKDTLAT